MSYRDGLAALRKRRDGGADLDRDELSRRLEELAGATFEDPDVFAAFGDVFDAVCAPPHITFAPNRRSCSLDTHHRAIHFRGDLKSEAGDTLGSIDRSLDLQLGIAKHNQIIVDKRFRNVALAAIILDHALEFYERIGIREVRLTAALTTGSYYWAKLGFDFADDRDSEATRHWFARVNAKLGLGMDCRETRTATEWLAVGREGGTTCSLGRIADGFPAKRDLLESRAKDIEVDMTEELPLGKALLLSVASWQGRLLVTRRARTRINAYIAAKGDAAADFPPHEDYDSS